MTILEDGVKSEDIQLSGYDSLDALHALMKDKGFHKKSGEEGEVKSLGEMTKGAKRSKKMPSKATTRTARLRAQGDVMTEDSMLESTPKSGFGTLAGIGIFGGLVMYYLVSKRKKSARSVV